MNNDFPIPITNATDLEFYDNYLKTEFPNTDSKDPCPTLTERLKDYIGKPVKIETVLGNKLFTRAGVLLEVGNNFLSIKPPQNCHSVIIEIKAVKFVTILQNSTKYPYF